MVWQNTVKNEGSESPKIENIKILIAEDHAITAKLLNRVLSRSGKIEVVGIARDGNEVIRMAETMDPDVILLDITMPYVDGITAMDRIFSVKPDVKVLILSGHTEAWVIKKSLNAGAAGYLTKQVDLELIIDAITTVHHGGSYLDRYCLISILNDYEPEK